VTDLLYVLILAADILAISDIMGKLRGNVERFLWVVCVICLPLLGAGFWIYVQYAAPRAKRLEREKRRLEKGGQGK